MSRLTEYSETVDGNNEANFAEDGYAEEDAVSYVEDAETHGEESSSQLPGCNVSFNELDDQSFEEEVETNWVDDKDPSKFIEYAIRKYRDMPKHNGESAAGAERTLIYLTNLNREFSDVIRLDSNQEVNIDALEAMRRKINNAMLLLSEHIKELHKKMKTEFKETRKTASYGDRPRLFMSAFERAITGMIISGVVRSGHSLEGIYSFLKKKYDFTPREELAIFQLLIDMGQPLNIDRGSISMTSSDEGEDFEGIDFVKNYFS